MENFVTFVNEHIPEIVSYALIVIGYMLYFFVKAGARKGANSIKALFKEKSAMIDETDKNIRKFVGEKYDPILLTCDNLEKENKILRERLDKQEKALNILIGGLSDERNKSESSNVE